MSRITWPGSRRKRSRETLMKMNPWKKIWSQKKKISMKITRSLWARVWLWGRVFKAQRGSIENRWRWPPRIIGPKSAKAILAGAKRQGDLTFPKDKFWSTSLIQNWKNCSYKKSRINLMNEIDKFKLNWSMIDSSNNNTVILNTLTATAAHIATS